MRVTISITMLVLLSLAASGGAQVPDALLPPPKSSAGRAGAAEHQFAHARAGRQGSRRGLG
jgi:hypothetical protein